MMHAIWLGHVFGPFLVIHGLWMLLCRTAVMKTEAAVKSSLAAFHMGAALRLLFGLMIVNTCCMGPVEGLSLLLAVLGWVLILRAILAFFLPKLVLKTLGNPTWNVATAVISIVWGAAIYWMAGKM